MAIRIKIMSHSTWASESKSDHLEAQSSPLIYEIFFVVKVLYICTATADSLFSIKHK